jgi:hypothetical protein
LAAAFAITSASLSWWRDHDISLCTDSGANSECKGPNGRVSISGRRPIPWEDEALETMIESSVEKILS